MPTRYTKPLLIALTLSAILLIYRNRDVTTTDVSEKKSETLSFEKALVRNPEESETKPAQNHVVQTQNHVVQTQVQETKVIGSKRPLKVHTVPAPLGSAAICQSVFPSTKVSPSYGCQNAAKSVPGLSFICNEPISITCEDSLDTAREKYYKHMMRDHCKCSDTRRFGKKTDGGWTLCMAGPYKPEKDNCLTYSVGIRDDWSFDDAISQEYGCKDMAFDPSIKKEDHKRSDLVWFYNIGLGGKDEEKNSHGWKMRTLASLMKQLGHLNKTIDMVKFDIEFSEWDSIATMLAEKALTNVKQIAFEIHTWRDTKEDYIYFWQQLQGLEEAGFQRWRHSHLNWRCFFPDGQKRYCPQVNMNFINTNYMPS